MCFKYHSLYRCQHQGKDHLEPCGEINGRADEFCTSRSIPSNRAFCCSATCCGKAIKFANERFSAALAQEEAPKAGAFERLWWNTRTKELEDQIEKRLKEAKKFKDDEEWAHWNCYQLRLAQRQAGRELQVMSRGRGYPASLPPVVEESDEEGEEGTEGEKDTEAVGVAGPSKL